jgi:hypothetical protein
MPIATPRPRMCRAYERGGSADTLVRGTASQEGVCESLKGVLVIDVLF